jgi:transcriptional regulator with XRE-family HTH domain
MISSGGEPESMPPEGRVGAALRQARESQGISLRQMAKRLQYNSHSTLSEYENGARMPSEYVVEGYERVLGLAAGELGDVLEQACIDRHGDAWTKRRPHLPLQVSAQAEVQARIQRGRGRPGQRGGMLAVETILLVIVVCVTAVVLWLARRPDGVRPSHVPTDGPLMAGAVDRTDPKVTGCAIAAETVDSLEIHDPPQHLVGSLQLRYSSRCGTSWARFEPTVALPTLPPVTLELTVHRPSDGAEAKFTVGYDGLPAYGNMLLSNYECVYAEMVLVRRDARSSTFKTGCKRGRVD